MLQLRRRAVALAVGGTLALGLPVGMALASTHRDTHGDAVAAVARSSTAVGEAHGDAVSAIARGSHDGDRDDAATASTTAGSAGTAMTPRSSRDQSPGDEAKVSGGTSASSTGDAHGDAVSKAARNHSLVGGTNDNHGGAVSAIARRSSETQPGDAHGDAVSAAATSASTSGEAHGDAVSEIARQH